MLAAVLRKTAIILISILILSFITFFMSRMAPGDPLASYYGDRVERMSPVEREHAYERLGLDGPIPEQYVKWLGAAFSGDFGISFKYKQDVLSVISGRLLNTFLLGGIGFFLTFGLALLLAVFCAYRENSIFDRIICRVGTVTSCIPEFWLSLVLILLFSVMWRLLPSSGAYAIGKSNDPGSRILHLILPLTVVVLSHLWYYAYMLRNRLLEEIRQEYVLLARAKGISKRKVMWKHCVRNILPTLISIMAISVNHILEGTYIVEMVFSYPGIGTLSFESAKYHDYNMLMVLTVVTGIVVIIGNIIGQTVSERIDRRMKAKDHMKDLMEIVSHREMMDDAG
ncbi:MAG: ABC transporter permease [Lachnospiraceae bacterium]|nr:ABC transporter permease [Lachnospiraceae bacterium]